jgi:hypothetical protein
MYCFVVSLIGWSDRPHIVEAGVEVVCPFSFVERCYQEYRKALQRYDPPPIDLKTPETFLYQKGGQLRWLKGKTGLILVLPEEILTPERIHELLPFLALNLPTSGALNTKRGNG